MDDAGAAERHERDLPRLAGLEPHGGAGRDIQPLAAGDGAVELQGGVGLGEMVVAADLDRPVAGVLATVSVVRGWPAFSTISVSGVMISPGIIALIGSARAR